MVVNRRKRAFVCVVVVCVCTRTLGDTLFNHCYIAAISFGFAFFFLSVSEFHKVTRILQSRDQLVGFLVVFSHEGVGVIRDMLVELGPIATR